MHVNLNKAIATTKKLQNGVTQQLLLIEVDPSTTAAFPHCNSLNKKIPVGSRYWWPWARESWLMGKMHLETSLINACVSTEDSQCICSNRHRMVSIESEYFCCFLHSVCAATAPAPWGRVSGQVASHTNTFHVPPWDQRYCIRSLTIRPE